MGFYADANTLDAVMRDLFSRTLADPAGLKELTNSNMRFRLNISNPSAVVSADCKVRPPVIVYGPQDAKVDLAINSPADLLHQVLLKEVRLRDAFFGGQMKVDGSIFRAMRLEGLFHVFQSLYPQVLVDAGLADESHA
jgi:putative sterol carrier protein